MEKKKSINFKYLLVIIMISFQTPVYCLDIDLTKFKNNKEVVSTSISDSDKEKTLEKHDEIERLQLANIFYSSFFKITEPLQTPKEFFELCEFEIIHQFHEDLKEKGFSVNEDSVESYLKALRVSHSIDDIFYDILSAQSELYLGLQENLKDTSYVWLKPKIEKGDISKNVNVKPIYDGFRFDPTNLKCSFEQVHSLVKKIKKNLPDKFEYSSRNFQKLNFRALKDKIIDRPTLYALEYLRKNALKTLPEIKQPKYFKIVYYTKDIKSEGTEISPAQLEMENDLTSKSLSRFNSLSNRKMLYQKYTDEEIVDLSLVIEKASKRIGEDPRFSTFVPTITQRFLNRDTNEIEIETLPLSPPGQFNYAKRRMLMDVLDLEARQKSFIGVRIEREDLITAAIETGYISHEDIEAVISYDSLWNKEETAWDRMRNYAFSITGIAVFYFPPPWNITGSLALAALNNFLIDRERGMQSDNPYVIIK